MDGNGGTCYTVKWLTNLLACLACNGSKCSDFPY